jgi:error-prone DNA polymerase
VWLGLDALAITDHDGMYGVVKFAQAAARAGLPAVYGAELSLGLTARQTGVADPAGTHLLVLAAGPQGYTSLCRVISSAHLRGKAKGKPAYDMDEVIEELREHCVILTGCRKGHLRQSLDAGGPSAADDALAKLADWFGADRVVVELVDHGLPEDTDRNELFAGMAADRGLAITATNQVHYARYRDGKLAAAMAAVRARRALADMAGWLPPSFAAHLRSGEEMAHRFGRFPGAVGTTVRIARDCAFDFSVLAPSLPPYPTGPGHTEDSWLRQLTMAGAADRYGPPETAAAAYRQLEHELAVIAELGYPGYFLIVHDLVEFCRRSGILCQGRGSAANSAVCYALGVTNADPIRWNLMFERFLSRERSEPPDIDIDIEAGRREEVIQYVYDRHGRERAAQVANVITYRSRSAVRDIAKALGYGSGQQDAFARHLGPWEPVPDQHNAGPIPELVIDLARQLEGMPRHLGVHSGGMVVCDRPVSEVCPVEWATAPGRTVLQWDKEDCAATGLVKFDLLGLGMLSAIQHTLALVEQHTGTSVDIAHLDLADQAVYDMLCRADTVGVFQVESRAQMATLPRLKPRNFWDLTVEVALIRPGPIQGKAVHPYLRRRDGEKWEHAHPLLANALDRTLGVPLFQEQVMQMAVDVASFTPGEADELRRAMGAKRSQERMALLRDRFMDGAISNGVSPDLAERIFLQVKAFAGYGFPMSHALSFAHIVFVSAHLKLYYPAAFCAGLLRAQPMGFYSPQSLVADARRHGVRIRGVDLHASQATASLEPDDASHGGFAIRLGLGSIRRIGTTLATHIVEERDRNGRFQDMADLARRMRPYGLDRAHLEELATSDALSDLVASRRAGIWEAGAAARDTTATLPGTTVTAAAPALPGMTAIELLAADLRTTGISPDRHPIALVRKYLRDQQALTVAELTRVDHGTRVWTGGVVTHRQRPATANGILFINLEDETGMLNVIVTLEFARLHRPLLDRAQALMIRGVVEAANNTINLLADGVKQLPLDVALTSRDYR